MLGTLAGGPVGEDDGQMYAVPKQATFKIFH